MMRAAYATSALALVLLGAVSARFWLSSRGLSPLRRLARVGYPLSQLVLVAYALWSVGRFGLGADGLLVISCAGVACALIDPWLFRMLERSEQLEAQRAREALLRERAEKGREALEEFRASGDALARLRESLAAGLDDVCRALDEGNTDTARLGLRRMSEVVAPVDVRFCENASVDALVASKVTEARARGVRLDVLASVPGSCDIPDVELCAVFANVLDNALAASATLCDEDRRWVMLRANVRAGHLVVRATNPYDEGVSRRATSGGEKDGVALHGWGLSILEALARRHGGSVAASGQGGVWTTSVVLPLGE